MGLFDFFKPKPKPATDESPGSLNDFKFYYLYGLVNTNPNFSLRDKDIADELYKSVIGKHGGILIGNSLHPYSIVDKDGCSIWQFAFIYTFHNFPETMRKVINGELMLTDLASKFNEVLVWPDTRLTYEESPVFGKAVPFIIPFVVHTTERNLVFDRRILDELRLKGDAHNYLEELNIILKKFMHHTAFAIGLDEFNHENPKKMIDNFMNVKEHFKLS